MKSASLIICQICFNIIKHINAIVVGFLKLSLRKALYNSGVVIHINYINRHIITCSLKQGGHYVGTVSGDEKLICFSRNDIVNNIGDVGGEGMRFRFFKTDYFISVAFNSRFVKNQSL